MSRSRFDHHECTIALSLDEIGDWWTLLIVREALYGTRKFDEFREALGIAKSVLAQRLKRLVKTGILERARCPDDRRSVSYRLTRKGRELWPVIVSIMVWGNRWVAPQDGPAARLVSRRTGEPVSEVIALDDDGSLVRMGEAVLVAGPGASPQFKERIGQVTARMQGDE